LRSQFLDCGSGGNVLHGGVYLRRATRADELSPPVLTTHGYLVLKLVAEELAKRIGKTTEAVRRQRLRRKIAPARDRRRKDS
jgi:hypothetical protein